MKMTVKWNANFGRDLARQIERSLSKVTFPIEVAEIDVESLDDACRKILLRLGGQRDWGRFTSPEAILSHVEQVPS